MRKRPELLVHLYNQAVSKYIKYKDRLDKAIRSGRFKDYRKSEQSKFIHRLNRLKAKIDQYQLKLKVAIAAGALALTLTALEPVQAQSNLGPFELQKRSKNPLRSQFQKKVALSPVSVDVDNDGDFDVVVGGDNEILFFKNNGTPTQPRFDLQTGPWVPATGEGSPFNSITFVAGDGFVAPAFANFDGDADMDLFLGTADRGFRYFVQNADRSFTEQAGAWNPVVGTGNPLVNFDENAAVLNGTFDLKPTFIDYDTDGDLDVVFGHDYDTFGNSGTQLHIIENDGTNRFPGPNVVDQSTNPFEGVVVGFNNYDAHPRFVDVDGSGDLDVLLANVGGELRFYRSSTPGVFVEQTGAWVPATSSGNPLELGFGFGANAAVDFVDLDGDTDLDALVFGENGNIKYEASHIRYLRNDGNFVFTELYGPENPFDGIPPVTDNGSQGSIYPAFIDYDLDSHPDVWVTELFSPTMPGSNVSRVTLYNNNQTEEGFRFTSTFTLPADPNAFPVEANINGIGGDDLVIAQQNGQISFFSNDGAGVFSPIASNDLNTKVAATSQVYPAFVDMDSDGDADAFVARGTGVEFYRNDGPSAAPVFTQITGTANPMDGLTFAAGSVLTSADANSDGFQDLFITNPSGTPGAVRFFVNQGDGASFIEYTASDRPLDLASLNPASAPKMVDIDQDGDKDIFIGALVFLPTSDQRIQFYENTNFAPVVVPNTTAVTFTAGGGAVILASALELNDTNENAGADDTEVILAKIQITANFNSSQDVLSFTPIGNITGTYDATTGTLTLTGRDAMATYETALQSVQYNNTSGTPTTLTRTITWYAFDHDATDPRLDAIADGTVSVNIVANAPPIVTIGAASVTYSGTSLVLAGGLTVTDSDDSNLESATISVISGFVNGEDVLSFTNQNGITGSYSAATGVLTLTGTSSVANYQTALRSITYQNNLATPVATNRIIRFIANDGSVNSTPRTLTVTYPSSNATPNLSTTTTSVTFTGTPTNIDNALTVADADNSIASATVQIGTGFVAGEDVLQFTDQNGIAGSFNGASGLLTLTGVTTVANWQTALRSILYNNTLPDRTNANRTITITVNDGIISSNTVSVTVAVPNQVPTLLLGIATTSFTGADLPLASALTIADADDVNLVGAVISISAGFASGEDQLIFTNQNGISGTYNSATGILTLTGSSSVANYQTALRTVAYRNTAADRTNANRTLSFTVNDGTVNSAVSSLTLAVPNQTPVLVPGTTTGNFTGTDLVLDAALSLSDADDINFSTATVSISAGFITGEDQLIFVNQNGITGSFNSTTGVLTLTGSSTIGNYQAALRSIVYRNTAVDRTNANRTVSFTVGDGTATSVVSSITLSVPNQAPAITLVATLINYTGADLVLDGNLTAADADDANLASASVSITSGFVTGEDELLFTNQSGITGNFNSSTGVLTLSGSSTVANYQAALRTVAYRNNAVVKTLANRSIIFAVNDGQVSTVSSSLQVALTNTAPVLGGGANSLYLSGDHVLAGNLTVVDADNSQLQSAEVQLAAGLQSSEDVLLFADQNGITGSYSAATGTLLLSGVSSVANYQAALRSVAYRNTASAPNTTDRGISIRVSDGNATSNLITFTLSINKPPVVDPYTQSTGAGSEIEIDLEPLVDDPDNAFSELTITVTSQQGATTQIINGVLLLDYSAIPNYRGNDIITISVCDPSGRCQTQTITITVEATVSVFNGLSPNGDGNNDYFKIMFLPPNSTVAIYNRWGDLVFEMKDYDHNIKSKRFEGLNSDGDELLSGTYFYKITLPNDEMLTGHLTIKK